jgi:hypothetical protein
LEKLHGLGKTQRPEEGDIQIGVYLFVCLYVLFFLQRKKSTKRSAVQEETYGFP